MFKHRYPAWHKTAQRCFFVIATVLCIALPIAYGKHHSISSKTLGAVLGIFFGLWLVFSLIARFLVPSPRVESTLPVYTHSPIRTPVILHSPTRPDALPSSPAIRLHPSSLNASEGSSPTFPSGSKGARFTDPADTPEPSIPARAHQSVKFQTRPRGNTTDSANSVAYPTFAAYRQAQHGNFEVFAQRVKRAFTISQQEKELQEAALKQQLQEQHQESEREHTPLQQQQRPHSLQLQPTSTRTPSSSSIHTRTNTVAPTPSGTRSRSASAASVINDIADRIKTGTFFRGVSNANPTAASAASAAYAGHSATTVDIGADTVIGEDPTVIVVSSKTRR